MGNATLVLGKSGLYDLYKLMICLRIASRMLQLMGKNVHMQVVINRSDPFKQRLTQISYLQYPPFVSFRSS